MFSAAVPKARFHCPFHTQTRSPMRDLARRLPPGRCGRRRRCRDDARPGDLAGRALARFDVGRIDAGGRELHPHFAGPGLRRIDLLDAQHLARRPVAFVISRPHVKPSRRPTISPRPWRRNRPASLPVIHHHPHKSRRFTCDFASIAGRADDVSPIAKEQMLFKALGSLDDALSRARHLEQGHMRVEHVRPVT